MKRTFWLYYNNKLLTAVHMKATATSKEVIAYAIESEGRVPLYREGMTPYLFRQLLTYATVRIYE